MAAVLFLCFSFIFSLVPLIRSYYCKEIVVSFEQNYFKSQLPDHCSVDYLGKGRVF